MGDLEDGKRRLTSVLDDKEEELVLARRISIFGQI